MHQEYLDFLAAFLAAISAYFWARSALVKFQFGYDMDKELNEAMAKTARFNAIAAGFAARAAATPAIKIAGLKFGFFI